MHYGPKVVSDSKVLVDALNSKSGSAWTDLGPSAFPTTLSNSPTFSSSGYFSFDGVNEKAVIGNSGNRPAYPADWDDNFSIEFWMYVPDGATWTNSYVGSLVQRGSYGGSLGIGRHTTDNRIQFRCRANGTTKSRTLDITRDAWYHIVGTWEDDVSMALYSNGILGASYDPSSLLSLGTPDTPHDWYVASNLAFSGSQGSYYEGRLAMVRIYHKALTAAEVLQNFNATRGRFGV